MQLDFNDTMTETQTAPVEEDLKLKEASKNPGNEAIEIDDDDMEEGELTESENEDQEELSKEAAEETAPPEAEMLENKENNEKKSSSSPSKSSRHSEKSSSKDKDSQKDKDSKSSRLKKELDAEEEKKRLLKEKLRQLERQMADEDDDFDEDDEDDNFPSNRKRRNSSTGSEKSRSKSPKRRYLIYFIQCCHILAFSCNALRCLYTIKIVVQRFVCLSVKSQRANYFPSNRKRRKSSTGFEKSPSKYPKCRLMSEFNFEDNRFILHDFYLKLCSATTPSAGLFFRKISARADLVPKMSEISLKLTILKDFFIRIFSENDQVPKIKVAEVRKGENIVLDVIEITRKIMKKNSEFANSLCSENVQKVQKDALFHMTVTHLRLWNYANSTFWKDVRKKKNACICTKAFPANIFILVTGNYFS